MFKVGDYLVYRRDVCKLIEIKKKYFRDQDYYVLTPLLDTSLKIEVPTSNDNFRPLISKEKVHEIIEEIPSVNPIECEDNRMYENEYKALINSGELIDLVKIIKTTFLRNKAKTEKKQKLNEKDNSYFHLAEKYLYQEFSVVLNMSYDDTKKYVIEKVKR